jgi:N-acetylneuraminic acid mutarotase
MAQQALGAGLTVPRKRALFGLLDADGWTWAGVKAMAWLVIIIMLLGYIPDRAYNLTVKETVELGKVLWAPVNFCSPENETLPCPAPVGAVVPWHPNPERLALPSARTDGAAVQVGTKLFYIGGSDGETATADVFVSEIVPVGNFDAWAAAPSLPEPRSDASVIALSGVIYVFGGRDQNGDPTDTVFILRPNLQTGAIPDWDTEVPEDLALLAPRAGAAITAASDGLFLIGGDGPDGPVTTTWKSTFDEAGDLQKWEEQAPLFAPQAGGAAAVIGDHVWLWGGRDANGPVGAVQRADIGEEAVEGLPENPDAGKIVRWGVSNGANLPAARDDAAGWTASGTLYLVGGEGPEGLATELYWSVPSTTGDLPAWQHLDVSDLPSGLRGASPVMLGPNAVLVGGETADGPVTSSVRSNTSPKAPFFQLGLVGATVPGLRIGGDIGQQLAYLNAAGAGTVNFIIVLLIGWAFAHKAQAREIASRVVRRRR